MTPSILLYDTHPAPFHSTGHFLRHAGFEVYEVGTGEAALELIDEIRFDVVIGDLTSRRSDAIDVLAHQHRLFPEGGKILAAVPSGEFEKICKYLHAVYIPKPMTLNQLLKRIGDITPEKKDSDPFRIRPLPSIRLSQYDRN